MLDFMRRQRSALKWVWVILIFIFSITLVTLYIPFGDLPNVSISNDVASIGRDSVSAHEFQAAYRNYIDRMRGQLSPEMLRAFRFERQIMDALVTRHVMTEEAKRLGLNASSAEVEQKILENPVFRENGTFIGASRYQAILAQNNLTVDQFESEVANEILTEKLRSFVTAAIQVTNHDVEEEYKRRNEIAKIKEKAQHVLERAKKGEDFSNLAKQFSEDTTAAAGGDLGDFGRGQMVPEFERVAFSLGVGAISDLVQTQFGLHIIKVTGKQEARERPFEELKEAIRPVVSTRKAEQKANDLAQQVAVDLVNNKNLEAVAAKYDAQVKETPLMEQSQPIPELGNAADFQRRMFMMSKGEIGTAIQVDRGYVVPQLIDIVASHPASFEEAQSRVVADVKTEKAKQVAADKAKQIEELLKGGKDLAAAAKPVGADIKTSEELTRGASLPEFGSIAELDKEMFSLPLGKAGTPITVAGKTLAFAVKERKEIDPDAMKKSLDTVRGELLPAHREQYFSAYIQEVKKRMEAAKQIKINESVLTQLAQSIS